MSDSRSAEASKKKTVLREWIESIVIAFLLAMVIRTFLVQAFKIPTGSMKPTLMEGDLILVNKFIYGAKVPLTGLRLPGLRRPARGDVVVFIYPEDKKKDFIKRLVGLPQDKLAIENGTLFVNGEPLLDPVFSQRFYYNRGDFAKEEEEIVVPPGNFFVLGDNSASSRDSRYWGFVPEENVIGKAILIYWPPQRIRIIK
ncbi:MAG: signal peptidase I [Candidatus Omnitrophota bacterium]